METQVLLYGGSFDPPHRGHVIPVVQVALMTQCQQVIYMPCAKPPQAKGRELSSDEARLDMLALTLEHYWLFPDKDTNPSTTPISYQVSDNEILRGDTSYTFDTVRSLISELPGSTRLRLLIGADQAANFHTWREADALETLTQPIVMMRPPWTTAKLYDALPTDWESSRKDDWISRVVPAPLVDISSTELRELIAESEWEYPILKDNLAPKMIEYLKKHMLYQG